MLLKDSGLRQQEIGYETLLNLKTHRVASGHGSWWLGRLGAQTKGAVVRSPEVSHALCPAVRRLTIAT